MRIRSLVAAVALFLAAALAPALTASAVARAQEMDGGVDLGGFANPATLQALLLYQLYGLQQQQYNALPEAQRQEMAKRAAEYFTNGAGATAVPTSGPGAAYFQNGAEVTAASTANAVPFGESAFPPAPEESVDASAPPAAATAPARPDASAPSGAATAPALSPLSRSAGDAGAKPSPSPSANEPTATTSGPGVTDALGAAESATPSTALAGLAKERAAADEANAQGLTAWLSPVFSRLRLGWLLPALAGLGLGAFALFLGLARRLARTRRSL